MNEVDDANEKSTTKRPFSEVTPKQDDTTSEGCLQQEIAVIEAEKLKLQEELTRKDDLIESLRAELKRKECEPEEESRPSQRLKITPPSKERTKTAFNAGEAVELVQKWLFSEGGQMENAHVMISEYCKVVKDMGIPLDRFFISALMLHPKMSAYIWKWEDGSEFEQREIPAEIFKDRQTKIPRDAPFAILHEGRANKVRVQASDEHISEDCQWFRKGGYQDYLALPVFYKRELIAFISWSTKDEHKFSPGHLEFFEKSLPALSTVIRLHANDLVTKTLMGRLEEEIAERTKELADTNKELADATRRILYQSKAQLRHFAMMSHEIRTPLNGVIGFSSVLSETNLTPDQREIVNMISSSGELLHGVVEDVLDYSKLASGKVEIRREWTSLHDVLNSVVNSLRIKASERGITIQTHIADGFPQVFYSNNRRLQQILYNLLGNAVKFSKDRGVVEFRAVCTASSPANESHLRLIFKNYGSGISQENLSKVFEPFFQVHHETNDGGTGLGLTIASKIADALSGSISVKSELGKWSEFVVDLPNSSAEDSVLAYSKTKEVVVRPLVDIKPYKTEVPKCLNLDSPKTPQAEAEEHLSVSDLSDVPVDNGANQQEPKCTKSGLKILIAEDNLVNQKLLSRILSRLEISTVDIVDNGKEAVEKSEKKDYDLILMDIEMPVMDGLEATRIIKSRPKSPRITFLSAHALSEIQAKADGTGADGFISKPFNSQRIRTLIDEVVKRKESPFPV